VVVFQSPKAPGQKTVAALGASSAIRSQKRLDEIGSAAAPPRGRKSRSPLEAHAAWLLTLIASEPDLRLEVLAQRTRRTRA
jgi:hypothetical protein